MATAEVEIVLLPAEQRQAFAQLLKPSCRFCGHDDVLPDVPEHIQDHTFVVLRPSTGAGFGTTHLQPCHHFVTFMLQSATPTTCLCSRHSQAHVQNAQHPYTTFTLAGSPHGDAAQAFKAVNDIPGLVLTTAKHMQYNKFTVTHSDQDRWAVCHESDRHAAGLTLVLGML